MIIESAVLFAFVVYLLALAWYDWRKKLLPVEPMIAATLIGFLLNVFTGDALSSVIGALVGAAFVWIQVFVSKGKWMGRGDIWFAASIGAFVGWPGIAVALYLAYVVGGVIAIVLYAVGAYKRGIHIAFAPFLTIGAIGSMLWGDQIAGWFARGFGLG
jgi:leader peptidase (prepilin peptidase)/N-methyltransferase